MSYTYILEMHNVATVIVMATAILYTVKLYYTVIAVLVLV